jgi:hypothetical protein
MHFFQGPDVWFSQHPIQTGFQSEYAMNSKKKLENVAKFIEFRFSYYAAIFFPATLINTGEK